jgi:hypothetical protein
MSREKSNPASPQERRSCIHREPLVQRTPMFWVDEVRLHDYLRLELKRLQPER